MAHEILVARVSPSWPSLGDFLVVRQFWVLWNLSVRQCLYSFARAILILPFARHSCSWAWNRKLCRIVLRRPFAVSLYCVAHSSWPLVSSPEQTLVCFQPLRGWWLRISMEVRLVDSCRRSVASLWLLESLVLHPLWWKLISKWARYHCSKAFLGHTSPASSKRSNTGSSLPKWHLLTRWAAPFWPERPQRNGDRCASHNLGRPCS